MKIEILGMGCPKCKILYLIEGPARYSSNKKICRIPYRNLQSHLDHLMIRDNKLIYVVNMRSNDAIFGYKNDKAWHDYVHDRAIGALEKTYPELTKGQMYWNAGSLHIYPRHFNLRNKQ